MPQLAFFTLGILHEPWGSPRVQAFQAAVPANFAGAAASAGNLAIIDSDETLDTAWADCGLFQDPQYANRRAETLTLWHDLESVFAFAYQGVHAEAVSHRKEWFSAGPWPGYVAWWVPDGHRPTWAEACQRYAQLHHAGPSPAAFDFKQAFDAGGQPVKVDRAKARASGARVPPAPLDPELVVAGYLAAWNERDPAARDALLASLWADDGAYTDRTAHVAGRAALSAHIGGFLAGNPGARFTLDRPLDHHHGHVRFFWTLHFANGAAVPGMDYGALSPEGKLVRIVGFF
jgi:hypothetical protein